MERHENTLTSCRFLCGSQKFKSHTLQTPKLNSLPEMLSSHDILLIAHEITKQNFSEFWLLISGDIFRNLKNLVLNTVHYFLGFVLSNYFDQFLEIHFWEVLLGT